MEYDDNIFEKHEMEFDLDVSDIFSKDTTEQWCIENGNHIYKNKADPSLVNDFD